VPIVATSHHPPSMRPTTVHQARMGPCRVPRGSLTEPNDDASSAKVSRLASVVACAGAATSHAAMGGQPDVLDAEACPGSSAIA